MSDVAAGIATKNPATISSDDFAAEALAIMNRLKINVLPVVDESARPVGILHMKDPLRAGVV